MAKNVFCQVLFDSLKSYLFGKKGPPVYDVFPSLLKNKKPDDLNFLLIKLIVQKPVDHEVLLGLKLFY